MEHQNDRMKLLSALARQGLPPEVSMRVYFYLYTSRFKEQLQKQEYFRTSLAPLLHSAKTQHNGFGGLVHKEPRNNWPLYWYFSIDKEKCTLHCAFCSCGDYIASYTTPDDYAVCACVPVRTP